MSRTISDRTLELAFWLLVLALVFLVLSAVPASQQTLAATFPARLESQRSLNLRIVPLGRGTIAGVDINVGGTGNSRRYENAPPGQASPGGIAIDWSRHDGLELVGEGQDLTVIDAAGTDASVMIASAGGMRGPPATKVVKLRNLTIRTSASKAIFAGIDAANRVPAVPGALILEDVTVEFDGRGRWGLFSDGWDLLLIRCTFRSIVPGKAFGEHGVYIHQFGRDGATVEGCTFDGAMVELFKGTARPSDFGGPYTGGSWYGDPAKRAAAAKRHSRHDGYQPVGSPDAPPTVLIRNSTFTRWGLGGQGGGVVIQGAAANVRVERCIFRADNGSRTGLAFAVDDSGVEHFGRNPNDPTRWMAGEPPANGRIVLEACLFFCDPGPSWLSPMIRVGSLRGPGNAEAIASSFEMRACGVYGRNRLVSLAQVPRVEIAAINVAPIPFYAQSLGIDTRPWQTGTTGPAHGVLLHIQGQGLRDLAAGFSGAAP